MVIRRGAGQFFNAISVTPPLLNTITRGGFMLKKPPKTHLITAKCFSNPHTDFGAVGQGAWELVRFATN